MSPFCPIIVIVVMLICICLSLCIHVATALGLHTSISIYLLPSLNKVAFHILEACDVSRVTLLALLDLSAAFDCMDIAIL